MKFILILILVLNLNMLFSQKTTNSIDSIKEELNKEKIQENIILPEVKLRLEDESEIVITNQTNKILEDVIPDFEKINIEELSKTIVSEKFKISMEEQRRKEDFSLSSFKVYYGSFDNLLAELNIGRRIKNVSYLITYLRNKRGLLSINNNIFYNSELEIDDLNMDFIYFPFKELELNSTVGYYIRSIGLYKSSNLNELKRNIPFKFNLNYGIDLYSNLKFGVSYDYLFISHKIIDGYNNKNLSEILINLIYEANWGKDNFIKLQTKYNYSLFPDNQIHFVNLSFIDRFPLTSYFSLEIGSDINYYYYVNYSNSINNITDNNLTLNSLFNILFPIINFNIYYKYGNIISLKVGFNGENNPYSINSILSENQIDYNFCFSEKNWNCIFGIIYQPNNFIKMRGNFYYKYYWNLLNYNYNEINDLYYFENRTNVQLFEIELLTEILAFENFSLNLTYNYKLPLYEYNLLFIPRNSASVIFDYKNDNLGIDINSKFIYQDIRYYSKNNLNHFLEPIFEWDFIFTYNFLKDLLLEIQLKNILNFDNREKPLIPTGGFGVNCGIKLSI